MSALSKGPYICVALRSLTQSEDRSKCDVAAWPSWLLDMKALDALSPPWFRKGPKAGAREWVAVVRQFGEHCREMGSNAATEGRVELSLDFNDHQGVALMVIAATFGPELSKERVEKEESEIAEAVLFEFNKLAKKSRSKTHPVMREWKSAPPGAGLHWPLDLLRLESGGKSERWADEFVAAIEASQIEAALSKAPSTPSGPKRQVFPMSQGVALKRVDNAWPMGRAMAAIGQTKV